MSVKLTFTELLAPIVGKPALMSALVLMGTYASFDFQTYAPALLLTLAIANHFFPRSRQWVVFLSLRTALFTSVSMQSTTGFITADYMVRYTPVVWVFILLVGVIGPMAGSTGGGLKCIRIMTAAKIALSEFRHILHPRAVLPVRIAGTAATSDVLRTMFAFFVCYFILLTIATLSYLLMGLAPMDAFGVAASMLSNVGPAIGHQIGATGSLNVLPDVGLWLSSVLMLIGRLEIFAILLPFAPAFWKEN